MLIKAYTNTYKTQCMILRPTNNFGPRQYPEKLIPLFLQRLFKGEKVPVYGDGMQVRDWLYVEDTCAAIDVLLEYGNWNEIYHVAGHNEKPNIEVIKTLIELTGASENQIEYVQDRLGHDRRYSLNDDKLRQIDKWKFSPDPDFYSCLYNTVEWYKKKFFNKEV